METHLQRWRLILGAEAAQEESPLLDKNQLEVTLCSLLFMMPIIWEL